MPIADVTAARHARVGVTATRHPRDAHHSGGLESPQQVCPVTRTCVDFAECMRDLVDDHYPEAEKIRVVLDNLSAHSAAALYQAFEPMEARRILSRLEFHFTPKHASWLNMVEIEIGVMVKQCLDRRIADKPTLISEIAAWEQRRNTAKARIKWMFTVERARQKMGRVYPQPVNRPQQAAA
jgi:hypothetical protein